jgi:hypothetical protein
MTQPTLSQILITRHLGDILAAYIQVSSAPLKKPSTVDQKSVDQTSVEQKSVDETSFDQKPINETSLDQKSVDETSVDQKSGDEKSEFVMTSELFDRFTRDQADFGARLKSIIEKVNFAFDTFLLCHFVMCNWQIFILSFKLAL